MSKESKFVESRVLSILDKKFGVTVNKSTKEIRILAERADIGLKTKAKIDYLINFCGYRRFYVPKL